MNIYLSGPVTGYPEGNKPLFLKVANELRGLGHAVVTPFDSESQADTDETLKDHYGGMYWKVLAKDILVMSQTDTTVFLPGWELSKGARLEAYAGLLKGQVFFEYAGEGEDLIPCPPAFVAGVCAAQWMEEPFKKFIEQELQGEGLSQEGGNGASVEPQAFAAG